MSKVVPLARVRYVAKTEQNTPNAGTPGQTGAKELLSPSDTLKNKVEVSPTLSEALLVVLNSVSADIPSSSRLRTRLEAEIRGAELLWHTLEARVVASSVAPKLSGLTKARALARDLQRALQRLPAEQRNLITQNMMTFSIMREKGRNHVDDMNHDDVARAILKYELRINPLLESLVGGLDELCDLHKKFTREQAQRTLRDQCLHHITASFRDMRKPLNNAQLAEVARALAPFFPPEADLDKVRLHTVQRWARRKS